MVRSGMAEAICMRLSGHRTRSTFDRYDITAESDLRDAVQRTEAYIESRAETRKAMEKKGQSGA